MRDPGKPYDIVERTFLFAVRVVRLCRRLDQPPGTLRTLSGQLVRAGTSVGSNVEEGQAASSRRDFVSKYRIALREARETRYRLRLLEAAGLVQDSEVSALTQEAAELAAILGRAVLTAQRRIDEAESRKS